MRSKASKVLLTLCACVLTLLGAGRVLALSTDKDQPIEIDADYAKLDKNKQITIYTGNVIVVQGSIHMTGDKLTVYYDDNQQVKEAYMDGKPAHFKQRPDGRDVDFTGEALHLEYHAGENLLRLIDHAKLTQGQEVMTGPRIDYDTEASILTARGLTADEKQQGAAPAKSGGRVHIVIPPKTKKNEPTKP